MKKNLLTLVLNLSVLICAIAQINNPEKFNSLKEKADIVVFGTVAETESFRVENTNMIFTKNKVKIHGKIKGYGLGEYIEVITNGGGRIGNVQQNWSHFLQIGKGEKGYFFLQQLPGEPIARGTINKFIGLDGFIPMLSGKTAGIKEFRNAADTIVEFGYDNIAFEEPNFLRFDVLIRTNVEGLEFGHGELYIKYPNQVFGTSVVANDNIEVNKGDVINTTSYSLAIADEENDIIEAAINGGCIQPSNLSESGIPLTTEFQRFLKVKLAIQDFTALGSLTMEEVKMEGNIYYFNPETYECLPFKDVIVPNPIDVELLCQITSFKDTIVTAGTGDTLVIEGNNFGLNPGTVEFPDADTGGLKLFQVLPQDIMFWSETLIKVLVPTEPKPAATGIFQVRTSTNMVCPSPKPLEVCYGVLSTHRGPGDSTSYRVNLGDVNNDSSYIFRPDMTINGNAMAVAVIDSALCIWNDATQINSSLGDVYTGTSPSLDNVNHIFFAPESVFAGSPNALATTIQQLNVCFNIPPISGVLFDYVDDVDIAVRTTLPGGATWYINTTGSPSSSQYDFFSVILHELGHAFHLEHSTPDDRAMYFDLKKGTTKRTLHSKDIMGVNDILDNSAIVLNQGLSTCPTPVGRKDLCISTSTVNLSRYKDIKIYPNPFSESEINIELQLTNTEWISTRLLGSDGNSIVQSKVDKFSAGEHSFTIKPGKALPAGVYFLVVTIGDQHQISKLVKF